jgi:hypothetical protein
MIPPAFELAALGDLCLDAVEANLHALPDHRD